MQTKQMELSDFDLESVVINQSLTYDLEYTAISMLKKDKIGEQTRENIINLSKVLKKILNGYSSGIVEAIFDCESYN